MIKQMEEKENRIVFVLMVPRRMQNDLKNETKQKEDQLVYFTRTMSTPQNRKEQLFKTLEEEIHNLYIVLVQRLEIRKATETRYKTLYTEMNTKNEELQHTVQNDGIE